MKWDKSNNRKELSKRELIEVQTEAFYRAMKRVETEKNKNDVYRVKEYSKKDKFIIILKSLACPIKIKNKYIQKNGITEGLFAMVSSLIMSVMGQMIRIIGLILFVSFVWYGVKMHNWIVVIEGIVLGILCLVLGVLFVWAGDEIEKEKDSNKIHLYTSNVLALIGLVVAIVALVN